MRNMLAKVPNKGKEQFIWLQLDRETAIAHNREVIDQYADVFPEAIAILEDGLEDSL